MNLLVIDYRVAVAITLIESDGVRLLFRTGKQSGNFCQRTKTVPITSAFSLQYTIVHHHD